MVTHYPFVIVPRGQSVKELAQNRPGLCLATFAAAAHDNVQLQRSLNTLFNKLISARLLKGSFASLDILQGLLVHVAWRYTQYLHLATSIVSDLRIDQPRKPRLWSVDGGKERDSADWGIEEMRALAGAYYLSSNTSILLHKSRHFTHSSYISRCVEYISANAEVPTDTHLRYLIQLQRLTEEIDDVWNSDLDGLEKQRAGETIRHVATNCETIKSSLPFPINESLPILFQFNLLELFLSQSSPGGSHYGVDKFDKPVPAQPSQNSNLIDWLSASISAAQSIIRIIIVLPSGEEAILSNISWIIIYCALSLAVRLDLTAAKTASTQFLRRFLDMSQTLRQICIRLEAASGEDADETGDRNAFYHLALRARRLEKWYQKQSAEQPDDSHQDQGPVDNDPSLSDLAPSSVDMSDDSMDFGMSSVLFSDTLGFPIHLDIENEGMWSDFTPAG
ncbi:unnamed protein product [Clonostachys byssicola]|uniref:Transcription factor domain-containing protein n=1 Tax=Clonostachys byssicola TaxID=160290 RepID=A0A9N9UMW6_9HYPO|nr:unnamed protein product [Clonostachys byssicola]